VSLKPLDVREVAFQSARRGYDEKQVDDFLDLVVVALEERDAALEAAKAASPSAPGPHAPDVVDLFAMAQRTAEEHVAAAQRAAQELLTKARQAADSSIADAQREAVQLRAAAHHEQRTELEELRREHDRVERRLAEMQQLLASTRAELETYLTTVLQTARATHGDASGPHAVPRSA
jgi:DivIVA domain-containing protein